MGYTGLGFSELVSGLCRHGDRFFELCVFADDIIDIQKIAKGNDSCRTKISDTKDERFFFKSGNNEYSVCILRKDGVARLSRASGPYCSGIENLASVQSLAKISIATAMNKKGKGWMPGLVLGMLIGDTILGGKARRILPLRFDLHSKEWCAYDGGLVAWLKSEFLKPYQK